VKGVVRGDHYALACIERRLKVLDLLDLDIGNLLLFQGFESKSPSGSKPPITQLCWPMFIRDTVGLIVHDL
jgi:hypothetical protein